jgi:hypothetical protein
MLLGQLLRSVPAKWSRPCGLVNQGPKRHTSPGAKARSHPGMCSSSAHLNTVGERILALKAERQEAEAAIAALEEDRRQRGAVDLEEACAILDSLPNLGKALAAADPQLRRRVYEAFRLAVEIDLFSHNAAL